MERTGALRASAAVEWRRLGGPKSRGHPARCARSIAPGTTARAGRAATAAPVLGLQPRPLRRGSQARAAESDVYEGVYGRWRVEEADVKEVTAYRIGISVAVAALLAASGSAFVPEGSEAHRLLVGALDPAAVAGIVALGSSLRLIHIYVKPLKQFLQLLWGMGAVGTAAIMVTQNEPAAQYVVEHPIAVLAVGPLFAAATGLSFKEGLCYGKFEAAGLFFVIPTLMLGHMFGLLPESGEKGLLGAFCVLATVFAARKYTQPIKDDIGDKSVFEFQELSEEEQRQRLIELEKREIPNL